MTRSAELLEWLVKEYPQVAWVCPGILEQVYNILELE